ncbi:MAG: 3-oxoacyl-ACP reductase FabG [Thermoanaerobacterium sp.]|nr:3-oxoacyl-ACP reductase FabG [Thermoanaerobacterium sp.]
MLLQDKVAIVTGSSRGIGRQIALKFASEGAKVIANYANNDEMAESLMKESEGLNGQIKVFKADVSIEESAESLVNYAIREYGKIDVLVNNAGITNDKFLINMSLDDWNKVIQTNLTGTFLCSKYAIRKMMRKKNGKIVNISSLSGLEGNKGQANYAASKSGLVGLTKTIAQEYSGKGIVANVIAPGVIDTDMSRQVPEKEIHYKLYQILKGHPGEPSDVAGVALFLASDLSNFVNGEIIRVDGGIRF